MDAIGVIMVFKFGWPQPDLSEKVSRITEQEDTDPKSIAKRKFHKHMSIAGLVCLVCGFGVQIIATWMQPAP